MSPAVAVRLGAGLALVGIGFASGYLFHETAEEGLVGSFFLPTGIVLILAAAWVLRRLARL